MTNQTNQTSQTNLFAENQALEVESKQRPRWQWLQLLSRSRPAVVGLTVIILIVVAGILAPLITPYDPNAQDYEFLEAPSSAHFMGTDDLGRDLMTRILYGARISLFVGVSTVLLSMLLGVTI